MTVKQKWAIIAKLNLYTRECDRKVDYGALGDVAEFFKIYNSHVAEFFKNLSSDNVGMKLTPRRFIQIYNPVRSAELAPNQSRQKKSKKTLQN